MLVARFPTQYPPRIYLNRRRSLLPSVMYTSGNEEFKGEREVPSDETNICLTVLLYTADYRCVLGYR